MTLVKTQTIQSPQTIVRPQPINLDTKHDFVFSDNYKDTYPEVSLWQGSAYASPVGLLFQKSRLFALSLPELCRGWTLKGLKTKLRAYVDLGSFFFSESIIEKGPALWVTDLWSDSYYHWLIEACPRLMAIKDRWDEMTLYLPQNYEKIPYIRESLEALGLTKVQYIDQPIFFENLFLPEMLAPTGHVLPSEMRKLKSVLEQSSMLKNHLVRDSFGSRIYISRDRANKRRILNEHDLLPILEKHHFKLIYMEDYSLVDQIRIMQVSRVLLGCHGAGFTNMLFMPTQSLVIEIRREYKMFNNTLYNLASSLDHKYAYCMAKASNPSHHANFDDITVDPEQLDALLDKLLPRELS